jgi:hypothetical protein
MGIAYQILRITTTNAARQHIADPGGIIASSSLYPSQTLT